MGVTFDWNISIGQIFSTVVTLGVAVWYVSRHSFQQELQNKRLEQLEVTVARAIESSDSRFVEMRLDAEKRFAEIRHDMATWMKESNLLGNTIAVLQQRMITVEKEVGRARDNIHHLANKVQAQIRAYDPDDKG